jgi:PBP1b-binding outer membrane lipoprotein LpoB
MITSKKLLVFALILSFFLVSCGPKAMRGGPGTNNAELDQQALSTKLDRMDIEYLVKKNTDALFASPFWKKKIEYSQENPPVIAILPIQNNTAEHLDDEMQILLSSIETSLVNSGLVNVVSRERQQQMVAELGMQQGTTFDLSSVGRLGKQLGVKYFVTGKLGAVAERMEDMRRMQYNLFIQILEVETSMVKFQNEAVRSKALEK